MQLLAGKRAAFGSASALMLALLAGCGSMGQEAGAGAGMGDYGSYMRQREAALNGQPPGVAPGMMAGAPGTGFSPAQIGAAIDAAGGAPYAAPGLQPGIQPGIQPGVAPGTGALLGGDPNDPNRPRGDAPAGIASQNGELDPNNSGISDEQDFGAVSSRETIQSDAERLARNRAAYQVIAPTALPERPGGSGPNIVDFALSTRHDPGTPMYQRSSLGLSNPQRACARYASPDLAQQAFLAAGGPEKDRKGLDPDGDGYACTWDPRPFRAGLN